MTSHQHLHGSLAEWTRTSWDCTNLSHWSLQQPAAVICHHPGRPATRGLHVDHRKTGITSSDVYPERPSKPIDIW